MDDVKNSTPERMTLSHSKLIPLLLVCFIALLFYPSIGLLYTRWVQWDEGLSHGLMIIGLFLFFLIKSAPWAITSQPKWFTLFCCTCLVLVSAFWFLAHVSTISILEQLALIPALILLVAVIFGWRTAYQQKMLLLMPIFAIPIWDLLNSPLVTLSSIVVGQLVQLISMPAVIDGNSIFIPYGHILIADGCSGIRYFVIALALGYIISYLNGYHFRKILLTLGIAIVLGLVANWVRIFLLVVVGYETEMKSSLMSDHEYFGWFIFALIGFPAIYFAPVIKVTSNAVANQRQNPILWIVAISALAIGPALNLVFNTEPRTTVLSDILDQSLPPIPANAMPLVITSPDPARRDNAVDGKVYFQIDQYQRDTSQDKLVPYINRLYDHEHWSVTQQETIRIAEFSTLLTQFRHKNRGQMLVQLQWFRLANTTTTSLATAKLLQIVAQLNHQNHFMIVSLQAECSANDCSLAEQAVIDTAAKFARTISPSAQTRGN